MKTQHFVFILLLVLCSLALTSLESGAYLGEVRDKLLAAKGEAILEVGAMPVLLPNRRQIIDTDKGPVCGKCLHIPYPTTPRKPERPGEEPLSSIQTTPPGGLRLLTTLSSPISEIGGGWSPDGKRVAYSINLFKEDWDISVVDADGKNRGPLISGSAIDMAPDWGPDGSRILFWSWRTGNPEVFTMNADGSGLRQLTDNLAWDMFPSWSPDGKKVAFDSDRMGNFDIWVMDVD